MHNTMQKHNQHSQNKLKKGLRVRINTAERDFNYPYTKSLLESFANGFDGFITKAYDLLNKGNHALQTTESAQPKIITGGTLNSDGVYFNGSSSFLSLPSGGFNPSNHEFHFKFLVKAPAQIDKTFYAIRTGSVNAPILGLLTNNVTGDYLRVYIRNDVNAVLLSQNTNAKVFDNQPHFVEIDGINGNVTVKVDGVIQANSFNYTPSDLFVSYPQEYIGLCANYRITPTSYFTGYLKSFESSQFKYNFV